MRGLFVILVTLVILIKEKVKNSSYNQSLLFFLFFPSFPTLVCFLIIETVYTLFPRHRFSQQIGAVSVEKMSSTKYEIEKFTGVNDFGLWCLKMKALLVQQGCLEALKGATVTP